MNKKIRNPRIREIIATFIKYGIGKGTRTIKNPVELRMILEELGPTFVKLGQMLSTRPDLLPEDFIIEFQKLQDNVKAENSDNIINIIEEEFNDNLSSIFSKFNKDPIASASMSQVHLATLKNGDNVVIKIQRPGIREKMLADIAILRRLAKITRITFWDSIVNLQEVVDELWTSANEELDFLKESSNIKRFFENNKDVKFITCPKVYEDYTTSKIITMEYIEGIKISNIQTLNALGYDLDDISIKLIQNYFKQIFEDGFFHGDPHPGNILINNTKIAYIDFGIMGNLNKSIQMKFNDFLYGIAFKDIDIITEAVLKIGVFKDKIEISKLTNDISEFYSKYIDSSLEELNLSKMMDDLIRTCRRNGISMPKDMVVLIKGIMTLEGLIANISPKITLMDIVIPYVKGQVFKNTDLKEEISKEFQNLLIAYKSSIKLPSLMSELIKNMNTGKTKIQMEHKNLDKSISELNNMINRIVWGLIVAAMLISSSIIVNAKAGPTIMGISGIGFLGYFLAAIFGLGLLISIIKSGKI